MRIQNPEPFSLQIRAFQDEAKRQQARSEEGDWKVRIRGHELQVRQLTVSITKWAMKIGDIAIQFAPSPGAGVWAVVTFLLQAVDKFDAEKTALLSVVDRVAGAIFRAEVYYEIYSFQRTKRVDVVQKLHNAMVDLYSCVLELLAKSSDLSSRTAIQFCHAIFDTQKSSELLSQLEQYERTLQIAAEYCEQTANARRDDDLKQYLQEAQLFLENFEQHMQMIDNHGREKLLEWISQVQYGRHFDEIEEKRDPGTGNWLIEHRHFRDWIKSTSSNILWLQGYPGTGKTFLTSAVVRHFKDNMEAQKNGLAYFFCNHAEMDRRETLSILQSLVRQLAAPKSNITAVRKSLQEARAHAINQGSHLGLSECRNQLLESLNLYSTTVIILDALDEVGSEEIDQLTKELDYIMSQSREKTVKLFISSRPEEAIRIAYNSSPTIIINSSDNRPDIERFLSSKLERSSSPVVNARKDQIFESILSNCDNVFLLADLQINQVLKCKTVDAIDYELKNTPRGLSQRYDRIYADIEAHSLLDANMAKHTLQWVMSAPEPLLTNEIIYAVRMGIENDKIKLKGEISPESLLAICENFIMVDSRSRWRFFHLSARDYLKEKPRFQDEAHSHCSQVCFLSLMQTFGSAWSDSFSFLRRLSFTHLNMSDDDISRQIDSGYRASVIDTLDPTAYGIDSSDDDLSVFIDEEDESSDDDLPRQIDSVYRASVIDALDPTAYGIDSSDDWRSVFIDEEDESSDDDLHDDITQNPFHPLNPFSRHIQSNWPFYASQSKRDAISFPLLKSFLGSTNESSIFFTRWSNFNDRSSAEIGPALRIPKRVCDWSSEEFPTTTPLFAILLFGLSDVFCDFYTHGDDFDLLQRSHDGSSLFEIAASAGSLPICKSLTSKGASVNKINDQSEYGSVLAAATHSNRNLDVVRYLVEEAHADVNLQILSGVHGSALAVAVTGGSSDTLEIVRYLVEEAGADVNLQILGGLYGSALAAVAAGYGSSLSKLQIVRYLVEEAHADVNLQLQAGEFGSALAAAANGGGASLGKGEVVRYLVEEARADVNLQLQAGEFGSALAAAAVLAASDSGLFGGFQMVRYLVKEAHADVNLQLQSGRYGSALAAAAASSYSDGLRPVKYLVEESHADVNLQLQAGDFGSALAAAVSFSGNIYLVKYLVEEAHADVNLPLQVGSFGSALAAATASSYSGRLATVKYLVEEAHADLNLSLPNGEVASALATARLCQDNEEIVSYLEQKEAELKP
ncbi:NACHT nucleoside triphosphatase [Penicillium herquei]|nr:NACHT nucleoside triphosphatase [Penicillium herquei]